MRRPKSKKAVLSLLIITVIAFYVGRWQYRDWRQNQVEAGLTSMVEEILEAVDAPADVEVDLRPRQDYEACFDPGEDKYGMTVVMASQKVATVTASGPGSETVEEFTETGRVTVGFFA